MRLRHDQHASPRDRILSLLEPGGLDGLPPPLPLPLEPGFRRRRILDIVHDKRAEAGKGPKNKLGVAFR